MRLSFILASDVTLHGRKRRKDGTERAIARIVDGHCGVFDIKSNGGVSPAGRVAFYELIARWNMQARRCRGVENDRTKAVAFCLSK